MRTRIALRCTEFALGVALFFLSGFASAQNLVLNPSFETLGQASWTSVLSGPAAWIDSAAVPPVTNGVNGLTSNQGGPSSQILYQDIVLPASGTFTFSIDVGCTHLGAAATDFCRVDLTNTTAATITPPTPGVSTLATTGAGVLQAVFSRDGPAGSQAQGPVTVIISGNAGQTIRVRLMVQASTGPEIIFADNLSFTLTTRAPIPTLSQWGMIVLSTLMALGAFVTLRRRRV